MEAAKPGLDEMYCSSCAAIIKRQAEICVKCGVRVATASPPSVEAAKPGLDEMYCPSCGAIIKRQAEICVKCGVRMSTIVAGVSPAMEVSQIGVRYAGFWKRFVAYIIDAIILSIVQYILLFILGDIIAAFGSLVGGWLYYVIMESSGKQGTLGKMALGIVVTDENGDRISFGRATGRYFGKVVSALILLIGFFMIGFTERKQGLHDIMAGCLVVNKGTE